MPYIQTFFFIHRFEISNFVSLYFLFFLLVSALLYYLFRRSSLVLLIVSIFFYITFSIKMTVFILFFAFANYIAGIILHLKKSKLLLLLIIVIDLGSLIYFKYANFFIENLHTLRIAKNFNTLTYLVIPIGISFFTFEAIHYVVDVHKGKRPVFNPINFFNFIFFYPTLIAGPIKRFEQFIPQLRGKKTNFPLILDGVQLVIKGLFKKIVIANTLSNFANFGFDASSNSFAMLIGVYAFALQIFFDFSGYTDIARGCAAIFGIRIPENFRSPYLASNIKDFWRKWHITLMQWIRDYIYIPLGGSKKGVVRTMLNTLVVFLISGLWHGAAWHYVLWGLYHGILMILPLHLLTKHLRIHKKILRVLGIFVTLNAVSFGWIFFRAKDLTTAKKIIAGIFSFQNYQNLSDVLTEKLFFLSVIIITYILLPYMLSRIHSKKLMHTLLYAGYSLALVLVLLSIETDSTSFVYFQF